MRQTFTISLECESGHKSRIRYEADNADEVEVFAGLLDGSINPAAQARMRELNDPMLRVGRCCVDVGTLMGGTVSSDAPEDAVVMCDAWIKATVDPLARRAIACRTCRGADDKQPCTTCLGAGWTWDDGVPPTTCPQTLRLTMPKGTACGRASETCPGCGRASATIGDAIDVAYTIAKGAS